MSLILLYLHTPERVHMKSRAIITVYLYVTFPNAIYTFSGSVFYENIHVCQLSNDLAFETNSIYMLNLMLGKNQYTYHIFVL